LLVPRDVWGDWPLNTGPSGRSARHLDFRVRYDASRTQGGKKKGNFFVMWSATFHRRRSQLASARLPFMFILIDAINITSWLTAWMLFSRDSVLFSAAVLAYILGLRHAVDADHIAAIDNVVRRLVQSGKRPVATGFFFSVGHSTVVLLAVIIIASAASAAQGESLLSERLAQLLGRRSRPYCYSPLAPRIFRRSYLCGGLSRLLPEDPSIHPPSTCWARRAEF
jgi:hypothetical protein